MKAYELVIITFKERLVKDKKRRQIKNITFYDNITFDLGKYLAIKEGCKLIFLDGKKEPTFKDTAKSAIGYTEWFGKGKIAILNPKISLNQRNINISEISIHPEINKVELDKKWIDWNKFDNFLENHEHNFVDFGLEAYRIWGPSSLIPKGYQHITEGSVIAGDYYFEKDHWINASVSFSPIKIGAKIEKRGWIFSGKHTGRKENEKLEYYNQFIIRKKPKKIL